MRFLCFRLCSKTKNSAVHEPTRPEEKPTVVEKSNGASTRREQLASVRDSIGMRDGSKRNTEPERKISIDQYSHVFIDEYASSTPGSTVDSERNC